jgi:hypothetical protein
LDILVAGRKYDGVLATGQGLEPVRAEDDIVVEKIEIAASADRGVDHEVSVLRESKRGTVMNNL